jgi:hypothetical protein
MKSKKVAEVTNNLTSRSFFPFTGGILFVAYAFFWPEQYGYWLGSIVRSFRVAAGL